MALEEAGAVTSEERDGLRVYRLTEEGAVMLGAGDAAPAWRDISRRAGARLPRVTLGRLLDRFELGLPRRAGLTAEQAESIDAALTRTRNEISRSSSKERSMDEFGRAALREREAVRIARRQWFWMDLIVWAAISVFLFVIWLLAGGGFPWFVIPVGAWGIVVVAHAAFAFVLQEPGGHPARAGASERERADGGDG